MSGGRYDRNQQEVKRWCFQSQVWSRESKLRLKEEDWGCIWEVQWPEWIDVPIGKFSFDAIFSNFDSSFSPAFYINTNKIIEAITIVQSYYFHKVWVWEETVPAFIRDWPSCGISTLSVEYKACSVGTLQLNYNK